MEGFFTFLIGFICFGVVLFLIFGLFSKFSGMSIKNSGIVSGGDTIVDPNTLDDVAKGLRKLVDKKYKIRKKIEEEYNDELASSLSQIDKLIYFMISLKSTNTEFGRLMVRNHNLSNSEYEIINFLGIKDIFKNGFNISNLSKDQSEKFDKLLIDLSMEKEKIRKNLKIKYDSKFNEMCKYL